MAIIKEAQAIMMERFHKDSLISLATMGDGRVDVRQVDGWYDEGCFYVVTYAQSKKMQQITQTPEVAVCGEWFTGHGIGENLGHVQDIKNAEIMKKIREAFAAWYGEGDVNESDPNTCLLKISLTDGILYSNGTKYEITF